MKFRTALTLGLALPITVLACGGDGGPTDPDPPASNQSPTASISVEDTEVDAGSVVQLDGSGSSDPDGDALTFDWTLSTPDGSGATLSDAAAEAPTFTADVEGDYAVTLTVSDGEADASDDVAITAVPCQPTLIDGDIDAATTYPDVCRAADLPDYIVSGTPDVSADVTIEADVRMVFEEEAGFRVDDGGAILAQGTQEAPIRMAGLEETPGYWRGLYFRSADRTSELNHLFAEHGGDAWGGVDEVATVVVGNDASVSFTDVSISGSDGFGLYVEPRGELSAFDAVDITAGTGAPVLVPDVQMGAVGSATTLAGNADDRVEVYPTGGVDGDLTISDPDVPYRMDGFFEVNAAVTVEAGVQMEFDENDAIRVNDGGTILAQGSEEERIEMRGTERVDGTFACWRGILFRADDGTSTLSYTDVRNGGCGAFGGFEHEGSDVAATISVDNDARLELDHSSVTSEVSYALAVNPRGELPNFESTEVRFTGSPSDDFGPPTPLIVSAWLPDKQLDAYPYASETGIAHVYPTPSGMDEQMTVHENFFMDGFFEVNAAVTLEGASLLFSEGGGMRVNDGGALFTRTPLDAADGAVDAQFDSGSGDPGWWRGILFRADDLTSELDNVRLCSGGREAHAGVQEPANVAVEEGARVTITNSHICSSGGWGVWLDHPTAAVFTEEGNTYDGNANGDLGIRP